MNLQRILHSVLLILLSVFINVNIVDDRFVSPLEDLSHQYQSYELEETTRVLSVQGKKQEQILPLRICLPFPMEYASPADENPFAKERDSHFSSILLEFSLLNLPPPRLV